jgi:hypothetical protein
MGESDVKVSAPLTATGPFLGQGGAPLGRVRIKGLSGMSGGGNGTVVLTSGGAPLLSFTMGASTEDHIEFPGRGVLAANGVAGALTSITSVTLIYEG